MFIYFFFDEVVELFMYGSGALVDVNAMMSNLGGDSLEPFEIR